MLDLRTLLEARTVYVAPETRPITIHRDQVYKRVNDRELSYDLYLPEQEAGPFPVVVFVHGDATPELLYCAKDWGQYRSWAELVACSGLAAVTFNHRSTENWSKLDEPTADVSDLITTLRSSPNVFGLDLERICLWVCSFGGPSSLPLAMGEIASIFRCIVAFYPILDLQPLRSIIPVEISDEKLRQLSACELIGPGVAPFFLARAGKDWPWLNQGIERFVTRALAANLEIELHNHAHGQHGFDVLDDCERSRVIIKRALEFMHEHLR